MGKRRWLITRVVIEAVRVTAMVTWIAFLLGVVGLLVYGMLTFGQHKH